MHAARWAQPFNRNANGVRHGPVCVTDRRETAVGGEVGGRLTTARWAQPFNRNANGVRALVHGMCLGRRGDWWRCGNDGRAARWAQPFNRNANGVRALVHGLRLGRRGDGGAAAERGRGPLGLRLNGDANGVRALDARVDDWWPRQQGARPVGPAVKRGRQRRAGTLPAIGARMR